MGPHRIKSVHVYCIRNSVIYYKNGQSKVKKAKPKCALRQSKDSSANDFSDEFLSLMTRSNDNFFGVQFWPINPTRYFHVPNVFHSFHLEARMT